MGLCGSCSSILGIRKVMQCFSTFGKDCSLLNQSICVCTAGINPLSHLLSPWATCKVRTFTIPVTTKSRRTHQCSTSQFLFKLHARKRVDSFPFADGHSKSPYSLGLPSIVQDCRHSVPPLADVDPSIMSRVLYGGCTLTGMIT